MKVLHILNELKPSGAENMLLSAAPFWKDHGVSCEILATGVSEGEYAQTLRASGYKVHHLPRLQFATYFFKLLKFVKSGKYDIVHQHAEGASYWSGLTCLAAGAKLVRTIHSNFVFSGNLRLRRSIQRRHLESLGTTFVAIAQGVQATEKIRFGIQAQIVLNWIDTNRFRAIAAQERADARTRFGFTDRDIVLITIGNCSAVKNHKALIRALASLSDIPQIRYLHVGMEDQHASEQQLVRELGIEEKVIFCGWTPNAREILVAADLYVMPSLYEGFSIAALEALGMGLPCLLSRVDGLRDLDSIFPSLIYTTIEASEIAESIRSFCKLSADARQKLSSTYPGVVQERFCAKRGVNEYCDIYFQKTVNS